VLDESTMTGESLPIARHHGQEVRSGVSNAGDAFELEVLRPAAESAYAALARLVTEAESSHAPFVRLADRYATAFLPLTLVMAAVGWALTNDPVTAVAVLVVATPCPLIIAAPVAIVSGLSRAARRGVVIKGGAAIEQLGTARTVMLDKTGTITLGQPEVAEVLALNGVAPEEILRRAASVDQFSAHQLAESLVDEADRRGIKLERPLDVIEEPGCGIEGRLDSGVVAVGSSSWLADRGFEITEANRRVEGLDNVEGKARIFVGTGSEMTGVIVMADSVRDDARATIERLRGLGIEHVAMLTGDHAVIADSIGQHVGVDRVYSDMSPEGKLEVVNGTVMAPQLHPVIMVGDGVNDAPALAAADVGIAMGVRGATISSESADAVIVTDTIGRVADAVSIGRRTMRIARQSVIAGISMSIVAMLFAAAGLLPPVAGAILQEGIDLAVILNALRALSD
jgi:heavy metal translocating P-type ATPase